MTTQQQDITLTRLAELLDAYGGAPDAWPVAERAAAERLIARDPEARILHESALALDAELNLSILPEPEAQLRARVLEIPIRHPRGETSRARASRWFGLRLGMLALVPCFIGFLSGSLLIDPAGDDDDDDWDEIAQASVPSDIFDEDVP